MVCKQKPIAIIYLCGADSPVYQDMDTEKKRIYFASDFHLGTDARLSSAERERQIVRWLNQIAPDAEAIYLVGDVLIFGLNTAPWCLKGIRVCWANWRNCAIRESPSIFLPATTTCGFFAILKKNWAFRPTANPLCANCTEKRSSSVMATAWAPAIMATNSSKKYLPTRFASGFLRVYTPISPSAWPISGRDAAALPIRKRAIFWEKTTNGSCNTPTANSIRCRLIISFLAIATCPLTAF